MNQKKNILTKNQQKMWDKLSQDPNGNWLSAQFMRAKMEFNSWPVAKQQAMREAVRKFSK